MLLKRSSCSLLRNDKLHEIWTAKTEHVKMSSVQLDSMLVIRTNLWNRSLRFLWFLSFIFQRIKRETRNSTLTNLTDPCYKWSWKLVLDLWSCSSKCMICRWIYSFRLSYQMTRANVLRNVPEKTHRSIHFPSYRLKPNEKFTKIHKEVSSKWNLLGFFFSNALCSSLFVYCVR